MPQAQRQSNLKRYDGPDNGPLSRKTDGDRLERIEETLDQVLQTLEVQFKRFAALQADVDLLKMQRPR